MSVNIIYYINLDHREDRKKEFMKWDDNRKTTRIV